MKVQEDAWVKENVIMMVMQSHRMNRVSKIEPSFIGGMEHGGMQTSINIEETKRKPVQMVKETIQMRWETETRIWLETWGDGKTL